VRRTYVDALTDLSDCYARRGLWPGGNRVVNGDQRRDGRTAKMRVEPGMHGRLIRRFPGQLGEISQVVLRFFVSSRGQVAGIEESYVDVFDYLRPEALVKLAPDEVSDDTGADPRVGQVTAGYGPEGGHEPWLAADPLPKLGCLRGFECDAGVHACQHARGLACHGG
jgi:hypothetical protein